MVCWDFFSLSQIQSFAQDIHASTQMLIINDVNQLKSIYLFIRKAKSDPNTESVLWMRNLSAPKSSIIPRIKLFLIVHVKSWLILALTIYWKWDERWILSICLPANGPSTLTWYSFIDPFSQIHLTTWTSSS